MNKRLKLFRVTTVPLSLEKLLENQLSFMQQFYDVTAISSNDKRLKIVGEKEGVKTFTVELTRKITPIKDLLALWRMYLFFKKEKPFIVHSHTPKAGLIAMLAAKLAGVPNRLHTVAGLPLLEKTGMLRVVLNSVEMLTYKCSTVVYPNSFGLKNIIEAEKLCDSRKMSVIGNGSSNGIDTHYFDPENYTDAQKAILRQKLGIAKDDTVFIFVGRLVSDKGVNELISAFDKVCSLPNPVKLILVGNMEADLDPLLPKTLERINCNKSIISVGYNSDVRQFLSISQVLTFPSYREGFPNVVMQAGAMGLPSIVSDINGCNEIIRDGFNGVLIPSKDDIKLAEAMKLFVERGNFLSSSEDIRSNIVTNFSQENVWRLLLNEYKSLKISV